MVTKRRHKLRTLDFDIENRPLSYLGMDFTTADITAIAWSWVGTVDVVCLALGDYRRVADMAITTEIMLRHFVTAYDEADVVTGHYIRKHDLPHINGALMEFDLAPLAPKLTCDTKLDLLRRRGISASQESLSDMLGLERPKRHMSQAEWREGNRLTKKGIALTKERVIADVHQHKALYAELARRGLLGPPKMWQP